MFVSNELYVQKDLTSYTNKISDCFDQDFYNSLDKALKGCPFNDLHIKIFISPKKNDIQVIHE